MLKAALANGGKPAMDTQDHGFMYASSFYEPDDHHWEIVWMDPSCGAVSTGRSALVNARRPCANDACTGTHSSRVGH